MNINEKWEQWEPIKGLSKKYYIDYILDDSKIFKIILTDQQDKSKKVSVIFENSAHSFRWADESYRLKIISILAEKYGDSFYGDWTFFKATNSEYLKWFSDQSFGIYDDIEFIHFSFIGSDSILDIIAPYEPKVEFIEE